MPRKYQPDKTSRFQPNRPECPKYQLPVHHVFDDEFVGPGVGVCGVRGDDEDMVDACSFEQVYVLLLELGVLQSDVLGHGVEEGVGEVQGGFDLGFVARRSPWI